MNTPSPTDQSSSIEIKDVLFVIVRHKWKIAFFTVVGLIAAGAIWYFYEPVYVSRAKLMVRYVTENRALDTEPGDDPDIIRNPETRGSTVINSEIEILTSLDSLAAAAQRVGPSKILGEGNGNDLNRAAGLLRKHLTWDVGKSSGVVTIEVGHRDGPTSIESLTALIDEYMKRHIEIHRGVATYDLLQQQTEDLRMRLSATERELIDQKAKAQISSLEQTKLELATQLSAFKTELYAIESEMAQRSALLAEYGAKGVGIETNQVNDTPSEQLRQEKSPETAAAFERLSLQLARLKTEEAETLLTFLESSAPVEQIRRQITDAEKSLKDLGFDPAMVTAQAIATRSGSSGTPVFDLQAEKAQLVALGAKRATVAKQFEEVMNRSKVIDSVESRISALQRKKEKKESDLRYYEANLDRARFDKTLDSGRINNISIIQEPVLAGRQMKKLYQIVGGALGGCVALGLALALAVEFFIDPTVKRRKELESKIAMPIFASIPKMKQVHSERSRKENTANQNLGIQLVNGGYAPWDENNPATPYFEALRDRIVMSYAGDPHKPKIVGVTSCHKGAGVTEIASGMAAALSRDAERNVLYIGLERDKAAVTSFSKGAPTPGFPERNFENTTQEELAIADRNLYSLATTGKNIAGASIVQSFSDLLPKLKLAEYDYIIFDLPPLSQTSGSLRLAAQMERVLLVAEAEKTKKTSLKRAKDLLTQSNKHVYGVLNKTRSYGGLFQEENEI